jgi:hypothetical protein
LVDRTWRDRPDADAVTRAGALYDAGVDELPVYPGPAVGLAREDHDHALARAAALHGRPVTRS